MRYGQRFDAGICRRTKLKRSKYIYNGIVYIVEDKTGKEVSCWAIAHELFHKDISYKMLAAHEKTSYELKTNEFSMLSHTVIVVDASGSMRNTDVKGARNRLQAVWLSLAQDFVAQRIISGNGKLYDAVTLILMRDRAEIIFEKEPTSW